MPMSENLEKLKELAIDFATKDFDPNPENEIQPHFLALNDKNEMAFFVTPWNNEGDKQAITELLRVQFKKMGIVAYAHVSEAWAKSYPRDVDFRKAPKPAQCEDRIEVIVIGGQDIDNNRFSMSIEVLRDAKGQRSLGKRDEAPREGLRGRMLSLLSEESDG